MTTGSYNKDYTTWGSTDCGANNSTMFLNRRTKSWSGADRIKPVLKPTLTLFPGSDHLVRRIWVKPPKRARQEGEHPYQCSWETIRDPMMYWYVQGSTWKTGSVRSCYGGGSNNLSNPMTANDRNKAIAKLQDKIQGATFDLSVFLGESNQALTMIADRATRLRLAFSATKRGNLAQARHHLLVTKRKQSPSLDAYNARRKEMRLTGNTKANANAPVQKISDVADNWLEMAYGWLPLVDDLYEASKTLAHFHDTAHQTTFRTSRTVEGALPVAQYASFTWRKCRNYATYSIKAIVSEVSHATLLGLTDPATVLWEVLPWSFVIDWALPIGTYLNARKVASAVTGTFVISEKHVYYYGDPVSNTPGFTIRAGNYYVEKGTFTRTVSTTLVPSRPSVKGFSESVSWMRALNATALLTQVLSRG